MIITLDPILMHKKKAFNQLIYLYNFDYDFSEYINDDIPEEGFFYGDADYYLENNKAHNYFIRVDGKIAGYVIIIDGGCQYIDDESAHCIDELFITKKYRRKGIGRFVAKTSFNMFKGKWEVCQMKNNISAQLFWKSVITDYTSGHYQHCDTENSDLVGMVFNN